MTISCQIYFNCYGFNNDSSIIYIRESSRNIFILKSSKRENKIYYLDKKKDDAINKMLKYLAIIIVMGLIIAFMDEIISRFISLTLLNFYLLIIDL